MSMISYVVQGSIDVHQSLLLFMKAPSCNVIINTPRIHYMRKATNYA